MNMDWAPDRLHVGDRAVGVDNECKDYSVLKLSMGLATAALIARKHTVSKAISAARTIETRNIHQPIVVL